MAKKPTAKNDDFRAKPVRKNDDFRKKATPHDRYLSANANEARKARSTLDYANTEIEKIGMPSSSKVGMGGDSLMRGVQALGSLGYQAMRKVQGKESLSSLKGKRDAANKYLREADMRSKSTPPRPDNLAPFRDTKDVPVFKMSKGGEVRRGDGCSKKGRTNGKVF